MARRLPSRTRFLSWAFAALAALALVDCVTEDGLEAGTDDVRATAPDGAIPDGSPARVEDAARDAGPHARDARLRLRDGGIVSGPLASVYDHRLFWDAAAEDTYAVLSVEAYAPYPADRSLTFVSSRDVAVVEALPDANPDPRFRAFERARGIVLERPPLDGIAYVIRGNDGYHLDEDGFGNHAWDFVRMGANGARFGGAGAANTDYAVWDEPVFLPTGGEVVEIVRDGVDHAPGAYPPGAVNNLVGVHLGGHYYVYLLHFRQGTIPSRVDASCEPAVPGVACVEVGAKLPRGAYLGRVGNSGVTLEPHLHVTLLYFNLAGVPARTWSVPGELASLYVGHTSTGPSVFTPFSVPATGDFVSATPF